MFETMAKISVMLISIITTFFQHSPKIQESSSQPTILVAIDIVNKPASKATKNKKALAKVTLGKKTSVIKPKLRSKKTKVSGYHDKTFVYGEVKSLRNNGVQGFIYHPDNSKTYVYGKKSKNKLNLYDANGNIYQMMHKMNPTDIETQ